MRKLLSLVVTLACTAVFAEEPGVTQSAEDNVAAEVASPCRPRASALPEGPVFTGYAEVDTGVARRACPRTEVGLGGRGAAIIDAANFYGALNADALLFGSWALPNQRTEIFATAEIVHWAYAQNATLKGTSLGLGQLSLGATHVVLSSDRAALAPTARMMLPTATGVTGVHLLGVELGLSGELRPVTPIELHAYAGADLGVGVFSPAPAQPRWGALVVLGMQYTPWRWFGVALDFAGHFGSRAAVDYVAPALALRFAVGKAVGIDLSASLPLAGADRHDFTGALRLTYRL
ncbi:MAG: hypothetical protein ACT4TC_15440 [Myxococcaceae bacterium]